MVGNRMGARPAQTAGSPFQSRSRPPLSRKNRQLRAKRIDCGAQLRGIQGNPFGLLVWHASLGDGLRAAQYRAAQAKWGFFEIPAQQRQPADVNLLMC